MKIVSGHTASAIIERCIHLLDAPCPKGCRKAAFVVLSDEELHENSGASGSDAHLMKLVQVLLPLTDINGDRYPASFYTAVRDELTDRWGYVTDYLRPTGMGIWQQAGRPAAADDGLVCEVLVPFLDEIWWSDFRTVLGRRFLQQDVTIRTQTIRLL